MFCSDEYSLSLELTLVLKDGGKHKKGRNGSTYTSFWNWAWTYRIKVQLKVNVCYELA